MARPRAVSGLIRTPFRQTGCIAAGNEVIDQTHVNQCQRFLHACGDQLVGLARLLDTRRVIVIHDAGGGTFLQRDLHDLAGMHRRAIDHVAEEIHALNDPVPFVE